MKKYIIWIVFLQNMHMFGQTDLKSIFEFLVPAGGTKEIIIDKKQEQKFMIGADDFSKLKKNKIFHFFLSPKKQSSFYLIPINSDDNFVFYVLMYSESFDIEENEAQSNATNAYMLFDKKNNFLFFLRPEFGASVTCEAKYKFRLNLTNKIYQDIIQLNNNFTPKYCIKNTYDENNNLKNSFIKYSRVKNNAIRETRTFNNTYSYVTLIPYSELLKQFNDKSLLFDSKEICSNKYCDCVISKFLGKNL